MQPETFTFTTPESLGIPSPAVTHFLNKITETRLNMHSFILLRHGKVATEAYWPPFHNDRKHRMYSISKSFTAIAVGMMIDEGKLSLSSTAAEFFPEYIPEGVHPYVMQATVRDLLMMSTQNQRNSYNWQSTDYTQTFFNQDTPMHKPGQVFSYDTAATTVLCAIVEKLSGKKIVDYMMPVLAQTGFSQDAYCIETPEGRSWPGSGILCTPRDLARFAQLCMNGGEWEGKQLLNRSYVLEATSWQIDTSVTADHMEMRYGYGYQIWRLRKGGFAFCGMGSQYAFCMPQNGTVLILTGDTQGTGAAGDILFNLFYDLVDKLSDNPMPEDAIAQAKLADCISKLAMPLPLGKKETQLAKEISGKKYVLDQNQAGMKWLQLDIEGDKCRLKYENASGTHELVFGMGYYEPLLFPEKYNGRRMSVRYSNYQCVAAAAWSPDNAFVGTLYSVDDHLGSIKLQLTFSGNEVTGIMVKFAEDFFDSYQGFLAGTATS